MIMHQLDDTVNSVGVLGCWLCSEHGCM